MKSEWPPGQGCLRCLVVYFERNLHPDTVTTFSDSFDYTRLVLRRVIRGQTTRRWHNLPRGGRRGVKWLIGPKLKRGVKVILPLNPLPTEGHVTE